MKIIIISWIQNILEGCMHYVILYSLPWVLLNEFFWVVLLKKCTSDLKIVIVGLVYKSPLK